MKRTPPRSRAHAGVRLAAGLGGHAGVRLAAGLGGLALTALAVSPDRVEPVEAPLFRMVNGLPDDLAGPLWLIMQGGTLAAAPVAAVFARLSGRPALARRLLIAGPTTWLLSKLVKRGVARPRPAALLPGTQLRGREQSGTGFVSGHAGVAASICAAALPDLGPGGRCAAVAAAATVAAARLYVGAHLPLDAVGGASLGIAVEAALELLSARVSGLSVTDAGL
jgi:membrane-associated phospholipid phosphatase